MSARCAFRHALGWLVFGNLVGLYLSLLLLFPSLQIGEWTYGKWIPVHLNVQLYGWTSLPLVGWLLSIYQVGSSRHAAWIPAVVWSWSAALAVGVLFWLSGTTVGKIFLDWKGGALWAFIAAQSMLWWLLAMAWRERFSEWSRAGRIWRGLGLLGLAIVPVSLAFATSPSIYPPVDRTTGGPTGASLLGSTLIVVGLMLILPRVTAVPRRAGRSWAVWIFFAISWLIFGVAEFAGGTHFDRLQLVAMLFLLPWAWWLPRDWAGFSWPPGTAAWRVAMGCWWGLLVVSGLLMYQPGVLDHFKFTQGLVGHSHLAMAGFTSAFCMLLMAVLSGRPIASVRTVVLWNAAVLAMVVVLIAMGWREGDGPEWMIQRMDWRDWGMGVRTLCGGLMLVASARWWKTSNRS